MQTGLSPHVIRVWERRYQAVTPNRSSTRRRLYSDLEVARLKMLRDATVAGHSIGNIARLPLERLQSLLDSRTQAFPDPVLPGPPTDASLATAEDYVNAAMESVRRLDSTGLEHVLSQGTVTLGQRGMIQHVLAPLTAKIGEAWAHGDLRVSNEHMASAVIRSLLSASQRAQMPHAAAPVIVVCTPAGQIHELGAAMAAALAAQQGWRVTYLGPNLPANEIAAAVQGSGAAAVALSIVYPEDDPVLDEELIQLKRLLPRNTEILIGGRVSAAYLTTVRRIGAIMVSDLQEFDAQLEMIRRRRRRATEETGHNN